MVQRKFSSLQAANLHRSFDQTITMEPTETITQHPSELLRQVGTAMNWRHTEILVTVPVATTWKTVLRATDSALGEVDGPVIITPRRPESHRQILRQVALQNVQIANSSS